MVRHRIANPTLRKWRVGSTPTLSANISSYSIVVLHILGTDETQVQFLLRAPHKCSIIDSSGVLLTDKKVLF